jgi:hypothetical protein
VEEGRENILYYYYNCGERYRDVGEDEEEEKNNYGYVE